MTCITMSTREINRLTVITELINNRVNGTEASEQLHLSTRQIRRLKRRVKKYGAKGLVHRGRGRESNRRIKSMVTKTILALLKKTYINFGPTLVTEKLLENHHIKISDETLRKIMIQNNLWKSRHRKKNKEYRVWRTRKENYGTMEQYDGSYHHWFEGRNEKIVGLEQCLLLAVDDATGKITKAVFDYHEGVFPTFNFWQAYIEEKGKPASIYLDKFSTYKINHKSAEDNKELITQFQRACRELDIELITAHSPEAKGRVERMFQTLQDRLVKELRLHNISDIETANIFLKEKFIPVFNEKFSVVPVKQNDLHRPLSKNEKENRKSIFSLHSQRRVMNDFTLRFKNKYFQLEQEQPLTVCRKDVILVEEHLNGSIALKLRGKELRYLVLPKRPEKEFKLKIPALVSSKSNYKPPADHPWRRSFFTNKVETQTAKEDISKLG